MAIILTEFEKPIDVSEAVNQFSRIAKENGGKQQDLVDIEVIVRQALTVQGEISAKASLEAGPKVTLEASGVVIVASLNEKGTTFSVEGQAEGIKDPKVMLIETVNTAVLICVRGEDGKYYLAGTIQGE